MTAAHGQTDAGHLAGGFPKNDQQKTKRAGRREQNQRVNRSDETWPRPARRRPDGGMKA
jgi:hypothetical protein